MSELVPFLEALPPPSSADPSGTVETEITGQEPPPLEARGVSDWPKSKEEAILALPPDLLRDHLLRPAEALIALQRACDLLPHLMTPFDQVAFLPIEFRRPIVRCARFMCGTPTWETRIVFGSCQALLKELKVLALFTALAKGDFERRIRRGLFRDASPPDENGDARLQEYESVFPLSQAEEGIVSKVKFAPAMDIPDSTTGVEYYAWFCKAAIANQCAFYHGS